MRRCSSCGHDNLPSFTTCSKCGASLAGVPHVGAQDEVARLMQSRAAAQKRSRMIFGLIGFVVAGVIGFKMVQDRGKKAEAQAKLDVFEKWSELDKRETGAFWGCVMSSEVNVESFSTAAQVQQRIESAYATQPKNFSEHLLTECVPKIERARQAFGSFGEGAAELTAPIAQYRDSLPKLQSGIEAYADKIKDRGKVKDLDQVIQEVGNAWQSSSSPTPESIAFDKFLNCAVPELPKLKDAQALLQHLATQCFKQDPVAFMTRVRADCGKFIAEIDPKATPSPSYKANMKKFYEEDARQLRAWEDCGRRSRKGKKTDDLEDLLTAFGSYMEARVAVAKAAKEIVAGVR